MIKRAPSQAVLDLSYQMHLGISVTWDEVEPVQGQLGKGRLHPAAELQQPGGSTLSSSLP